LVGIAGRDLPGAGRDRSARLPYPQHDRADPLLHPRHRFEHAVRRHRAPVGHRRQVAFGHPTQQFLQVLGFGTQGLTHVARQQEAERGGQAGCGDRGDQERDLLVLHGGFGIGDRGLGALVGEHRVVVDRGDQRDQGRRAGFLDLGDRLVALSGLELGDDGCRHRRVARFHLGDRRDLGFDGIRDLATGYGLLQFIQGRGDPVLALFELVELHAAQRRIGQQRQVAHRDRAGVRGLAQLARYFQSVIDPLREVVQACRHGAEHVVGAGAEQEDARIDDGENDQQARTKSGGVHDSAPHKWHGDADSCVH
jgi:hypothetical protein